MILDSFRLLYIAGVSFAEELIAFAQLLSFHSHIGSGTISTVITSILKAHVAFQSFFFIFLIISNAFFVI